MEPAKLNPLEVCSRVARRAAWAGAFLILLWAGFFAEAGAQTLGQVRSESSDAASARARRFLRGRAATDDKSLAQAMDEARTTQAKLVHQRAAQSTGFDAPWQPLGPAQVTTAAYGKVTGRVTAIAIDPADATG